ncbi:MAG: cache domain-containing protein [Bacteroidota bacterium]
MKGYFTLRTGIFFTSLLTIVLFILAFFYVVMPAYEANIYRHKNESIRELTKTVISILDSYHKDYQNNVLSKNFAQRMALIRLKNLRYGADNKDYFWVSTFDQKMLMHPYRPDLDSTDLTVFKDPAGKKLFEIATPEVLREGETYESYVWQWKDDSTKIVPKLSYFRAYEPWGWIVGTGVYIEELEKEIQGFKSTFLRAAIVILLILLVITAFIVYQSNRLDERRKMAESQYQESIRRYESQYHNFPNPVYTIKAENDEFIFIDANKAAFDDTKGKVVSVFGKTVKEIWGDEPELLHAVKTTYKTKSSYNLQKTYQYRIVNKTAEIEFTFGYIPDDLVLVYFVDVTEKKRYIDALSVSETKYRTLFDYSNDAIFILDTDIKIVDCNQKGTELQGYAREEIIGRSPFDFSPEIQPNGKRSLDYATEIIAKTLKGKPQIHEWSLINEDKSLIYTVVSMNRFDLGGIPYLQVVLRDVTDKRKLEKQLLTATIRAEENERARFAKELHDGVGPLLSTVKLYFQWLAEVNDESKKQTIISKGNENIQEAINALREISNNLSPHILNMFGFAKALQRFTEGLAETQGIVIDISNNLNLRLPKQVEVTLYRITTELINNTLKYASASSIRLIIDHKIKEEKLIIDYFDDGIGFDSTTQITSGKGLGLNNIRSRIKTLGGNLELTSEKNKGVHVSIYIDLTQINREHETKNYIS